MVRTLNVTLDNSDFENAERVKEELGLTWQEFVIEATDALEQLEESD